MASTHPGRICLACWCPRNEKPSLHGPTKNAKREKKIHAIGAATHHNGGATCPTGSPCGRSQKPPVATHPPTTSPSVGASASA